MIPRLHVPRPPLLLWTSGLPIEGSLRYQTVRKSQKAGERAASVRRLGTDALSRHILCVRTFGVSLSHLDSERTGASGLL